MKWAEHASVRSPDFLVSLETAEIEGGWESRIRIEHGTAERLAHTLPELKTALDDLSLQLVDVCRHDTKSCIWIIAHFTGFGSHFSSSKLWEEVARECSTTLEHLLPRLEGNILIWHALTPGPHEFPLREQTAIGQARFDLSECKYLQEPPALMEFELTDGPGGY